MLTCIYYTAQSDYLAVPEHIITCIDRAIRLHQDCGIIVTGDVNQMNDTFLRIHYRLCQVVGTPTIGLAILNKIWTNMNETYFPAVTISELGLSDHAMVLLRPNVNTSTIHTGHITYVNTKVMGPAEKAMHTMILS